MTPPDKVARLQLQRVEKDVVWRRSPFPRLRAPRSWVSDKPLVAARKETVPLNRVIAGQDAVTEAGVRKYMGRGKAKLPVLIRAGGNYFIRDGHHRLTADYLRGKKAVTARVVDVGTVANLKGFDAMNSDALTELTARVRLHQFKARGREQGAGSRPEGFLKRNRWRIAGGAAAIAGIAVGSKIFDKGMRVDSNPHRSVMDLTLGRKNPQAAAWEQDQLVKRAMARSSKKRAIADAAKTARAASPQSHTVPAQQHVIDASMPSGTRAIEGGIPGKAAVAPARPIGAPRTPRAPRTPERLKQTTDYLFRRYQTTGSPRWIKATIAKGSKTALPNFRPGVGDPAKRAAKIASLRRRLKFTARLHLITFNTGDARQGNRFAPTLEPGTILRKGQHLRRYVARTGNLAQDLADAAAGRRRQAGKKREWEKSWVKNAAIAASLGGGIVYAPRAYQAHIERKTGEQIGTTAIDMLGHIAGRARRALRAMRTKRFAARFRALVAFDTAAALRGWDLRDPRGKSARVFAPGSRRRERREKTEWEKVDRIRAVRNALAVAAVAGAGTAGYLGYSNRALRLKLKPKITPASNVVKHNFRKAP